MYSNMKSYYFSVYSGYNRLSGRRNANAQRFNLICLTHSFNTFIFTCSPTSNPEVISAVIILYYIMQWMLTIVQAAINKGWNKVIPQCNKHFKIQGLLFMYLFKKFQMYKFSTTNTRLLLPNWQESREISYFYVLN